MAARERATSAYANVLARVGLTAREVPALMAAERFSKLRLLEAQRCLAELDRPLLDSDHGGHAAVFAFGSLGRLEASAQSDLDLAFLFDGSALARESAEAQRRRVIAALRERYDIPEKTFDRAIDIHALTRNIGGREDTNDALTYRALLLTEGAWLGGAGRAMKAAVFRAYAHATISRGRFLTSLGNDLHRYYRTLCMDYRHKVEALDKGWAIRVLKLRHSRKLWHLANIALQCWAVDAIDDDDERDVMMAARIGWPSLLELVGAVEHFGAPELAREPFVCLDRFLAELASSDSRRELAGLHYPHRRESAVYRRLHDNAERLDAASAAIVALLFERCQRFMVRFCIL